MEQHNIDSRFKQGLENLNRQPSEDAWARLQARMSQPQETEEPVTQPSEEKKEEKRLFLWWHYAAAAVVLLFISFGILRNGSQFNGKTEMPIAVNKTPEATILQKNASDKIETESENASGTQNMIAATRPGDAPAAIENKTGNDTKNGSKTEVKTTFSKTPEVKIAKATRKENAGKVTEMKPVEEKTALKLPVQVQEEPLLASAQSKPAEKATAATDKKDIFAGMVIEVVVKKDNSQNALAQAQPVPEENQDSRLKGIVKQAINFKKGEPVDLQALGLSADSKVAMGTRNITQKFSKVLDI